MTLAPLVIAIVIAVAASFVEKPRLDASSTAVSLESSLQKVTAGMSDTQKKEFLADCMELTLPGTMKSAFERAFLSNGPPATTGPRMYRPLQGMTAAEIHRKAEGCATTRIARLAGDCRRATRRTVAAPVCPRLLETVPMMRNPIRSRRLAGLVGRIAP